MIRYRDSRVGGCLSAAFERDADGVERLRSTEALLPYPERLTDRLEQFAREAPARTLAARRERGGDWRHIGYLEMLNRARAVGQALVDRGLSAERPVAILSGNDLEHLTLALGAMWAGIPYAPISTAYSLISQDFGRLRHILDTLTPGLVFASGPEYARAIDAVVDPAVELVLTEGRIRGRAHTPFDALAGTAPGTGVDDAHARVGPDTIVKFLFTSGSTRVPKGVVNTHRMLCANQQMLRQGMAFLADEAPVLVDWLPWNHTFGGNHNVGIVIYNGGSLYIDDGKPTPQRIGETLRNLREISPTVYFNVPKGFEEIVAAMRGDEQLRRSLLRRVRAFMFAGAGLAQPVWDELDRLAEATLGERIPMITGLGMTETAPTCTLALRAGEVRSGHIGLPCPGVEVKLVPTDGKNEIRFRGPNVMPGYWRLPEASAQAFDEEGFYRTGDAAKWLDPGDPRKGLLFDGRIAEDFKLSTGTFVSVGPLRARVIAAGAPCVQDVVITGIDRDEVGMLVFPRLDACRGLAGAGDDIDAAEVLRHPAVLAFFQALVDRMWRDGSGSASRIARALLMSDAPSIDRDELTDKGSINQRAVLRNRAELVERLHGDAAAGQDPVLLPRVE
ncbi:MAG TPA: feruloyl-CoA synthase [Rubrivivax sp.]|nr:feruloyl-CoA synthase [Rubrivivax sp.]